MFMMEKGKVYRLVMMGGGTWTTEACGGTNAEEVIWPREDRAGRDVGRGWISCLKGSSGTLRAA